MSVATTIASTLYSAAFSPAGDRRRWYALHTRANHEKCLAEQFTQLSVEHYLPLYESVRRWKDRRKTLQLPLFPGYILVRIDLRDRLRVLQAPGAARLVGFNGTPLPLQDSEIDGLRQKLTGQVRVEPHPYLQIGRRVRVKCGTLAGLEGILIRKKQKYRIVLSIEMLQRSIAAEVDIAEVELLH
jgi:transcription antitermination factor NusG